MRSHGCHMHGHTRVSELYHVAHTSCPEQHQAAHVPRHTIPKERAPSEPCISCFGLGTRRVARRRGIRPALRRSRGRALCRSSVACGVGRLRRQRRARPLLPRLGAVLARCAGAPLCCVSSGARRPGAALPSAARPGRGVYKTFACALLGGAVRGAVRPLPALCCGRPGHWCICCPPLALRG